MKLTLLKQSLPLSDAGKMSAVHVSRLLVLRGRHITERRITGAETLEERVGADARGPRSSFEGISIEFRQGIEHPHIETVCAVVRFPS